MFDDGYDRFADMAEGITNHGYLNDNELTCYPIIKDNNMNDIIRMNTLLIKYTMNKQGYQSYKCKTLHIIKIMSMNKLKLV